MTFYVSVVSVSGGFSVTVLCSLLFQRNALKPGCQGCAVEGACGAAYTGVRSAGGRLEIPACPVRSDKQECLRPAGTQQKRAVKDGPILQFPVLINLSRSIPFRYNDIIKHRYGTDRERSKL